MSTSILRTIPVSSLCKLFPERDPEGERRTHFSALQNEPLSFQIAYRLENTSFSRMGLTIRVESALPVRMFRVGYVALPHTEVENLPERERPGVFPDILQEKQFNLPTRRIAGPMPAVAEYGDRIIPHASRDCFRALWLTVGGNGTVCPPGEHTVTVRFFNRRDDSPVGECTVTVRIAAARLPQNTFLYTNWVHCDCLADLYGVPIFSDRFFEIYADYIRLAAEHGMNTLLTPCFTPPLDTPIGEYRMPAQLVGVRVVRSRYQFDFSLLRRFLRMALSCGITHFEHSHLFSQWGATCAPAVYATVRGKTTRIFGWDTPVASSDYPAFLRAYLPALLSFLREEGLDKRFLFHISDEPSDKDAPAYAYAQSIVKEYLDGYPIIDALSHYSLYEQGLVETPVVVTTHVKDFLGRCRSFWCYYTGGQCAGGQSNRFTVCSALRNRMLGVQMYAAGVRGFLHWAYNYYYDEMSQGLFDPLTDPDGFAGSVPGTTYMVYPAPDGHALPSIRQKVFYEGINDLRALRLLEKRRGRAFVMDLLRRHFGDVTFDTMAESPEALLAFRDTVNALLDE